jgi:hypothetical protein|tara:strand:- start:64 stop:300 length:237 start_codon:yes stop_codon:yes gene_type:complete
MSASKKQIELIEKLHNKGAPIPENDHGNPDGSMFESVENADKYIKKYGHFISSGLGYNSTYKPSDTVGPGEWGGVYNS